MGLASLPEWDVLIFLYRHRASLANAEQIARLVGYPSKAVGEALARLESQKLIERSRSSQGVRFYQFVQSDAPFSPEGCIRTLLSLSEHRSGRLRVIKHLRQSGRFEIAAGGTI